MTIALLRSVAFGSLLALATAASALAQSGSAGGSIGNDEKSLSGSRPNRSTEPALSTRRSKPATEEPRPSRRVSRDGGGAGAYDGSWIFNGTSTNCQGSGSGAFTVSGTRVTVAGGGGGSVSPSGSFQATTVTGGVTLTARGRLSGSSGGGSYTRSDAASADGRPPGRSRGGSRISRRHAAARSAEAASSSSCTSLNSPPARRPVVRSS